jgi:hypothetical protein
MAQTKARTPAPPDQSDDFDFAPAWRPEVGESIRGVITLRSRATSEFGEYIALTIRPPAGRNIHMQDPDGDVRAVVTDGEMEVTVHCFGTVLDNALRRERPKVGETIGFKSLGKRLPKGKTEESAKSTDWFNAWQVRILSDRGDDALYGPAQGSRERDGDPGGEFNDEPPF